MASNNMNTANAENSLKNVVEDIKSISSTILSLGFVLYVVGFVVTNVRLSKFGAYEISLLEPRYLTSGILALFVVLVPLAAALLATIRVTATPLEGNPAYRIIRLGDPGTWKKVEGELMELSEKYPSGVPANYEVGKDNYAELDKGFPKIVRGMFRYAYGALTRMVGFSLLASLFYIGAFLILVVLVAPAYEEGGVTGKEISWTAIRGLFFLQAVCLLLIYFPFLNKPFRHEFELLKDRVLAVFLMSLVSILIFANGFFAEIPFVLGGGKPEPVCLGLVDKSSKPTFEYLGITVDHENSWTQPVQLIFESEKAITILVDDESSASIKKDLIASVRYKCVPDENP